MLRSIENDCIENKGVVEIEAGTVADDWDCESEVDKVSATLVLPLEDFIVTRSVHFKSVGVNFEFWSR